MIFSAVSSTTTELSRTPKPSDVSTARNGSAEFFGKPEQLAVNQIFQLTFELFHGDSTYRPRDWAIKISPTFSLPNYLNARERSRQYRRAPRNDAHGHSVFPPKRHSCKESRTSIENFDFVSLRAGIQPFVSDFRGFIFSDGHLGARLFGSFYSHRYQYNGLLRAAEKDTTSGLNARPAKYQNVYAANIFRQISSGRVTRFRPARSITTIAAAANSIATASWFVPR
jgi:hypothetical protein